MFINDFDLNSYYLGLELCGLNLLLPIEFCGHERDFPAFIVTEVSRPSAM